MLKKYRSFVIPLFLFITSAESFADESRTYLMSVWREAKEECPHGRDFKPCLADIGPKRCEALVYNDDMGAWNLCVRACAREGYFSKTFGDCS